MIILDIYKKFLECGVVTTDSRAIKGGEMFFALKGENFDGNEYALRALEAGAAYSVVNAEGPAGGSDDPRLIKVEDTLKTLQELARWHRSMTIVDGKPLTVIALTGTNGKTTTKELIREVLSVKYRVTATEGNLNNSIGVPLTLLKINPQTQLAVVEMGASHPGDIKELVDIALPNYGLVTNVGKAHLLGFGSFEGVKSTKGELYDYLRRTSDKVFLNVDNPHLCQMASERNLQSDPERPYSLILPYGLDYSGAKVLPSSPEYPYLRIDLDGRVIATNLVGAYNADNVMAALAVGEYFGVSREEAVKAVEAVDACVGKVWEATKEMGGCMFLTADHGNADKMIADDGETAFTQHTTFPVPVILVSNAHKDVTLREGGVLADLAPTLLDIMTLPQPKEMTGKSLIK